MSVSSGSARARTLQCHSEAIPRHLGEPLLVPVRLSGHEALNELFTYELFLKTPDGLNPGVALDAAANLDLDAFIGREITCSIELDGAGEFLPGAVGASVDRIGAGVREISGLITDAQLWGEEGRRVQYKLTIRPWLHLATLSTDCKIFQNQSVVETLDELLADYPFPVEKRLIETYPKRDYGTGRAHIPQGHVLAQAGQPSAVAEADRPVPRSGYWLPQLLKVHRDHEREWDNAQVPQRYEKGEAFEPVSRASMGQYARVAPRTVWHYVGVAVPQTQRVHPKVAQGLARPSRLPEPSLICRGYRPCPRTGIWYGYLPDKHPLAARYNRWDRQTYLEEGQAFPDPAALQLDVAQGDVRWLWCDNANAGAATGGVTRVTLSDLHDAQGKPLA